MNDSDLQAANDRHPTNEWGIMWSTNDVVRAIQFALAELGLRPNPYNQHRGLVIDVYDRTVIVTNDCREREVPQDVRHVYINLRSNNLLRVHMASPEEREEFFDPNVPEDIDRLLRTTVRWCKPRITPPSDRILPR